ncbi:MAG: Hint domain-containing protein, partial [Microvirga sp.]
MSEHKQAPSLARRHFLGIAAAVAGRVGAVAALSSLQIVGSSRPAKATYVPPVPCFLRGTNILTSKGEARVQDLSIGDRVVTADGEAMPIKWIGRNLFKKTGTRAWPQNVQPIRVSRFAIDDETPHADLYLSPKHALYVDGVLIPVENLINGMSVRPATPEGMDVVEYFHIELKTHEVI